MHSTQQSLQRSKYYWVYPASLDFVEFELDGMRPAVHLRIDVVALLSGD
jgi:hypothetical protein